MHFLCAFQTQSRELVNTAVLSGQPLSVPLRLLLVDGDGQTIEVTSDTKCRPANPQVVKVWQELLNVFLKQVFICYVHVILLHWYVAHDCGVT